MKLILRLFLLALITLHGTRSASSGTACGRAQTANEDSPRAALNRAFDKGNLLVALSPVDWRPGLALAATWLRPNGTVTVELALNRHQDYAFVATTAPDADLDLYLRDSTGTVLVADQQTDGTPIVEFRVPRTGNYRLQLHLAATENDGEWVALALLQSAGKAVPENQYRQQADRFFTLTDQLTATEKRWLGTPGCWAVQGFVLASQPGHTMTNFRPGEGVTTLATTPGRKNGRRALYLADEEQKIVATSAADAPFPVLSFPTLAGKAYQFRLETANNALPELVLIAAFEN